MNYKTPQMAPSETYSSTAICRAMYTKVVVGEGDELLKASSFASASGLPCPKNKFFLKAKISYKLIVKNYF
jgi:hypothetical protein